MTITTVPIKTIVGMKNVPITTDALGMIENEARAPDHVAHPIWMRMLDAQREMDKHERNKTTGKHAFIAAASARQALSRVMADLFGMSPWFWEQEVAKTTKHKDKS